MKTILQLSILFLLVCSSVKAQIYTGSDVILSTQAEVDAFGANNYTEVQAGVTISGNDITNLNALNTIETIGGTLRISENQNLTSFKGLDNLTTTSFFFIVGNSKITDLDGLGKLETVNIVLVISRNNMLENLQGLNVNLDPASLLLTINITDNDSLVDISLLGAMPSLYTLDISRNKSLISLSGLENVSTLNNGILFLIDNENLSDCGALCNLLEGFTSTTITGNNLDCFSRDQVQENCAPTGILNITLNTQNDVNNFKTTYNITSIPGYLHINNNVDEIDPITNLQGLDEVTTIGDDLIINKANGITDLQELDKLKSVNGNIYIYRNDLLENTNGLALEGNSQNAIELVGNENLSSINPITNAQSILSLEITNNDNLPTINDVTSAPNYSIGSVSFNSNPKLTAISFSKISEITQSLSVSFNPELLDINVPSITSINDLNISFNNIIENLNGLTSLTSLTRFTASSNESLTDFCGLSTFFSANQQSFDQNNFNVANNAYNPTIAQIIDPSTCSITLSANTFDNIISGISISPNPTTNTLQFNNSQKNVTIEKIRFYSINGAEIGTYAGQNLIDISNFKAGMYLVNITTNKGNFTQKIIKN